MTVPSAIAESPYTGNGAVSVYSVGFYFLQNSDIIVYETDTNGVQRTLSNSVEYTLTGAGNPAGGFATRTAGVLPTGYKWLIARNPDITQPTDLRNQGDYYAEDVERIGDRNVMISQALNSLILRTLHAPLGDSPIGNLPPAAIRANKSLGFDGSGNPTIYTGTFTGLPSSSLVQVIDTIPLLKALAIPSSSVTYAVRGATAIGDQGAGIYYWNSASVVADNGDTVLQLNVGGTGRFVKLTAYDFKNGGQVYGLAQFNKPLYVIDQAATFTQQDVQISRTVAAETGTQNDIGVALNIAVTVPSASNIVHAEIGLSIVNDCYGSGNGGMLCEILRTTRHNNCQAWGSNIICQDATAANSGTQGIFGLEVNLDADASDVNLNRKLCYFSTRRYGVAGTATFYAGLDITAEGNTRILNGLVLKGAMTKAISIEISGVGSDIGIDMSGRSGATGTALRIRDFDIIALNTTGTIQMRYHTSNNFIEFLVSGVRKGYIDMAGADHAL